MKYVLALMVLAAPLQAQVMRQTGSNSLSLSSAAATYVNKAGDTMTGALTVQGKGTFKVGTSTFGVGGVFAQANYATAVTTTAPASAAFTYTTYSTITIPAGTLARNGDSVVVDCNFLVTLIGVRNINITVTPEATGIPVVVSSRTANLGTTGFVQLGSNIRIYRGASNVQVIQCHNKYAGSSCNGTGGIDFLITPFYAFDDTQTLQVSCVAGDALNTQGNLDFISQEATFYPAP